MGQQGHEGSEVSPTYYVDALATPFSINTMPDVKAGIANSRGPETLKPLVQEIGSSIHPISIEQAYRADMIFLAVPFSAHKEVAHRFKQWNGKVLVDVTNALHVAPGTLGDSLSSEVVATAFVGALLVKAFNHLPAAQLGTNPPAPDTALPLNN